MTIQIIHSPGRLLWPSTFPPADANTWSTAVPPFQGGRSLRNLVPLPVVPLGKRPARPRGLVALVALVAFVPLLPLLPLVALVAPCGVG
jgi:hypothetical protein